jgi:O-antigen/teichoic acid export membrane protein
MSLRKNTLWNLAGSGFPLVAAAALIPFMLEKLGYEAFGVLTLIWALIGYFSVFDMGVGRALTYELSKLRSIDTLSIGEQQDQIARTVQAGLLLTFATGVIGTALMFFLAPGLATQWLKISPALREDAIYAFQIAAIGIIPTTITSGLRGALEGLERFADSNLNKMFLGFFMFAMPAISIFFYGNQLWLVALYLVLTRLLLAIVAMLQLKSTFSTNRKLQDGRYFENLFFRIKPLLSYGVWMTITGIVGPLMMIGDRFFVSAATSAAMLPVYVIPQEMMLRLLLIPAAISGALLPYFASLSSSKFKLAYVEQYKKIALIMLLLCFAAALAIYPVLSYWISKDFADQALPVALVMSAAIFLNGITLVPYTYIHASGNTRITALFHLTILPIYYIMLWQSSEQFGIVGAAASWLVRVAIELAFLSYIAHKIGILKEQG